MITENKFRNIEIVAAILGASGAALSSATRPREELFPRASLRSAQKETEANTHDKIRADYIFADCKNE